MNSTELLKLDWDTFVGRRQPPLRGFLVYEGFIAWLKKRFHKDFYFLFLYFSEKKEDVLTDSFVNLQLEQKLKKLIQKEFQRETTSFHEDIKTFYKTTNKLLTFCKGL